MPKLIISLTPNGLVFKHEVIFYCQTTGQPSTPESWDAIYFECLSQIMQKMHPDFQSFMANMMELPCWATIHYLDTPVDYDLVDRFRNAMRAFAITVWHTMKMRAGLDDGLIYVLESCTDNMAIVGAYVDASTY